MESKDRFSDPEHALQASRLLDDLRADRANLAERLRTPWWLAPGFGLVAAGYVSSSAFADDGGRSLVFIAALVGSVALIGGYRRATGVKLAQVGWRARAVVALAVVASLMLLSVSDGLAAAGLRRWIAVPMAAGFALVTWLAAMFTSAAQDRMRDDR